MFFSIFLMERPYYTLQDFIIVELSQYICCKINFVQYIYQYICMCHKMVILFDTLSILLPTACCLRELFGNSWTKTLQYLVCQIQVPFICSKGIFSDRETLELPAVSVSFEDFLPCLTFIWFCFICRTVPFAFICDYCKCRRLSEPYVFLLSESHTHFSCVDCHIYPSIFQWNCLTKFCVTVAQGSFINY